MEKLNHKKYEVKIHWCNKPDTVHIVTAINEFQARSAAVQDSIYGSDEFYTPDKCKIKEI